MRATLLAAASVLALSAVPVMAQDAPITDQHLDAVDTDNDGAVSQSEFSAAMAKVHATLDADADGVVSWAEAEGKMAREHFDALDGDADGGVSTAEMDTQAQKDFSAADKDGDGSLN